MARKRNLNSEILVSSGGAAAAPARRVPSRRGKLTRPDAEGVYSAANPSPAQAERSAAEPAREEIAALAYSYWEERGGRGGSPQADWDRAERALRERASVLVAQYAISQSR